MLALSLSGFLLPLSALSQHQLNILFYYYFIIIIFFLSFSVPFIHCALFGAIILQNNIMRGSAH